MNATRWTRLVVLLALGAWVGACSLALQPQEVPLDGSSPPADGDSDTDADVDSDADADIDPDDAGACVSECGGGTLCGVDDGCGDPCLCPSATAVCHEGRCCEPTCGGVRNCGDNGCGGSCGVCGEWQYCAGEQTCQACGADNEPCCPTAPRCKDWLTCNGLDQCAILPVDCGRRGQYCCVEEPYCVEGLTCYVWCYPSL